MNFCDNMSAIDDIGIKCNIPDGFESVGYIMRRKDIDFSAISYGGSVAKPASLNMGSLSNLSIIISEDSFSVTYGGKPSEVTSTMRKVYTTGTVTYVIALASPGHKSAYSAVMDEAALLSSFNSLIDATQTLPPQFVVTNATSVLCYEPTYVAATTETVPSVVIDDFSLVSGAKAYKINQLKNAFTDTEVAAEVGDYRVTFTNNLAFKIFDQGPKVAAIVNGLANGEFVVILEQKDKSLDAYNYASGESKWRVFGIENGLTASEITNNAYDDSIGNGWSVKMEEKASSSSEYFIFKDDLTTTDALIASLY